jgi:hypothetical protein
MLENVYGPKEMFAPISPRRVHTQLFSPVQGLDQSFGLLRATDANVACTMNCDTAFAKKRPPDCQLQSDTWNGTYSRGNENYPGHTILISFLAGLSPLQRPILSCGTNIACTWR